MEMLNDSAKTKVPYQSIFGRINPPPFEKKNQDPPLMLLSTDSFDVQSNGTLNKVTKHIIWVSIKIIGWRHHKKSDCSWLGDIKVKADPGSAWRECIVSDWEIAVVILTSDLRSQWLPIYTSMCQLTAASSNTADTVINEKLPCKFYFSGKTQEPITRHVFFIGYRGMLILGLMNEEHQLDWAPS